MTRTIHIMLCLAAVSMAACASSFNDPEGGGGSCSGGVVQGYYSFISTSSYNCGGGYIEVVQQESQVFVGALEATIDDSCSLHFTDERCVGVYRNGGFEVDCGECAYAATPIIGSDCEDGVETGFYDVNVKYEGGPSACTSGYKELTQSGYFLSMGDLSGTIDDKCAVGFSDALGSSCTGTYAAGKMALDCGDCTITATAMPLVSSFSFGPYTLGSSYSNGNCSTPALGRLFRLSVTDAYLDSDGALAMTSETSLLEAHDAGNNLVFSAPLNSDGTAQFIYGDQTIEAWFTSFELPYYYKPSLKVSISPSGCEYTYSPN